ncbi:hypothetical protein [Cellulophaga baltica]|uniref:hypothetical protein n=1 Tax=Cellulophaga baltica TaxID=76594 RepID=UPI00041D73F9|nr:hypothetical protein [Cellulophaga baltica]
MEKKAIPKLPVNKLSEFDQARALGWVLDRAVSIEERINDIIFIFFEPKKKEIFISHVLNSSVMSYG